MKIASIGRVATLRLKETFHQVYQWVALKVYWNNFVLSTMVRDSVLKQCYKVSTTMMKDCRLTKNHIFRELDSFRGTS